MNGTNSQNSSHFKRRKRRGSYLGVTGKYPSPHNQHPLFYESLRERDFFVYLTFCKNVVHVEDHPFTIEYQSGGKKLKYTPDAAVRTAADGEESTILVEIKLESDLQDNMEKYADRFDAATAYGADHGMAFRVVTDTLLSDPLVRNLRFLAPYRSDEATPKLDRQLLRALDAPAPLRRLCDTLSGNFDEPDVVATVWRLVANGLLKTDLCQPLSMNSFIEPHEWEMFF